MSAELLSWLIEGTLATSAAVLVVLALRKPMVRSFGAACAPLLWALVPLAQLAVWLPAPVHEVQAIWQLAPSSSVAPEAASLAAPEASSWWARNWIALGWGLGVCVAVAYFLAQQLRFRRRLGRLHRIAGNILRSESIEVGPAVLGLIRPRIILPADFTHRFSETQQSLILEHERSHLRRGDVIANAIATALRCLYWFNPLLHYAASRLRHDHELASDADVVQRHPRSRRQYADTLLNVQLAVPGLPVGCLWQSSHPLKERILMLSTVRTTHLRRRGGILLACTLALGAGFVAWAGQPASQRYAGVEDGTQAAPSLYRVVMGVDVDGQTYTPELHFDPAKGFAVGLGEEDARWDAAFEYDAELRQFRNAHFRYAGEAATPVDLLALSRGDQVVTTSRDGTSSLRMSATVAPLDGEASPADWIRQPITLDAKGVSAREAVERVLAEVGMGLERGDVIDSARPGRDLDFAFDDIPALTALQLILAELDVKYGVHAGGLRVEPPVGGARFDAAASTPPAADQTPASYRRLQPPEFPADAIEAKESGVVLMAVDVDETGQPTEVAVSESSGSEVLDLAAVEAVRGWRFNPAQRDGVAVASRVQVPICFSLAPPGDGQGAPEGCSFPATALDGIYRVAPGPDPGS